MVKHRILILVEVVEEEQDTKTDTERVGDFQDSIAGCGLSGDLGVDLLKQSGDVYVIVKGHNGKACTEKGGEADKYDFAPSYNNIDSSFLLIGAAVPLLGFGNTLWKGLKEAIDTDGVIGLFTGGFTACAAGVSAALIFSYLASWFFKPKMKE